MRAAFGVAIGISAIDALLSAFTAMIVLALVIVSPTTSSGGSIARETHVLRIEKSAPVRLLLEAQSRSEPAQVVALASSSNNVLGFDAAPFLFASPAGHLTWLDPACRGTRCVSSLTVTQPRAAWRIRVRVAGDVQGSTGIPADLRLTLNVLGRGAAPSCKDVPLSTEGRILARIVFDHDGGLSCE